MPCIMSCVLSSHPVMIHSRLFGIWYKSKPAHKANCAQSSRFVLNHFRCSHLLLSRLPATSRDWSWEDNEPQRGVGRTTKDHGLKFAPPFSLWNPVHLVPFLFKLLVNAVSVYSSRQACVGAMACHSQSTITPLSKRTGKAAQDNYQ